MFPIKFTIKLKIFSNLKKRTINQGLQAIEESFSEHLATAYWTIDFESIDGILKGILSQNSIIGIKINNPKGN